MIYRSSANCSMCAHFQGEQRCQAFPAGIPVVLWSGENLHREPYPNDQGIQFQPRVIERFILEDILPEAVVQPVAEAA